MSWTLELKNGIIKGYQVKYIRKDDSSDTKTLSTKTMEQQFKDLKAGKTYEFQVNSQYTIYDGNIPRAGDWQEIFYINFLNTWQNEEPCFQKNKNKTKQNKKKTTTSQQNNNSKNKNNRTAYVFFHTGGIVSSFNFCLQEAKYVSATRQKNSVFPRSVETCPPLCLGFSLYRLSK